MRVLHSHPIWLPLTQTWLAGLVGGLPPHVESAIVCNRVAGDRAAAPAPVYCERDHGRGYAWAQRAMSRTRWASSLSYRVRVARRSGAQVIHSHFGHVGWHDLPFARAAGLPHVVSFYGQDAGQIPQADPRWRERYGELFASAAAVLCEGPFMARTLDALGCPPEKLRLHHLGVALDRLPFRPRARRRGEPLRVLMAASFREKKGLPDGLRAVALAAREGPLDLTLIGDAGPDAAAQAEKRAVGEALRELPPHVRVRTLGFQPFAEVLREAYAHHVFLHPSRTARDGDSEGGAPVAVLEMAATGMVIVATRHCDMPEILPASARAGLVPERSPESLAEALVAAGRAPERWLWQARENRAHVEEHFSALRQGYRLAGIYAGAAAGERAGAAIPRSSEARSICA